MYNCSVPANAKAELISVDVDPSRLGAVLLSRPSSAVGLCSVLLVYVLCFPPQHLSFLTVLRVCVRTPCSG